MKKINYLMGLGLFAASLAAQAQTTIASVGFEEGDRKWTTPTAYTPGGTWGDWVNRQESDVWNEQYAEDKHSGNFCMSMNNSDAEDGQTWLRGFRLGDLPLKDNTSYRVSFWVKADPTFYNSSGEERNTSLKTSLGVGREYCDMPICTKSGIQYYYNYTNGIMTGDWKHVSFMTYQINKATLDEWSANYTGKEDANGVLITQQGDPFPNEYFLIINMYNPGEYLLDDIKVEEGVTFNEATFSEFAIKLDFGYPTNIADIAAAEGYLTLDASQFEVKRNGNLVTPETIEAQKDGYVYIFFAADDTPDEKDEITVTFTPNADCPIFYNSDRRPSAKVDEPMAVIGFTAESCYYDPAIDALPATWSAPKFVTSVPENGSFELSADDTKEVRFTFNKELDITETTASLTWKDNWGEKSENLENITLSEDKCTIIVGLPALKEYEYTVTLSDVNNINLVPCEEEVSVSFQIGIDEDESEAEDIYVSDFDNELTGGIPRGWDTFNEAGHHLFGYNDPETQQSQFNYNWGGNPGGGGARLYEGFSGDFQKAMYWGTRGTEEGYASYGELVKNYMNEDGTFDPNMPEGIELKLEPRKYQISFLMAAWKGEPTFTFTLEDLDGGVYAKFDNILAAPNANGATGKITGSVKCITDFSVEKEGYYVLKFTSNPAVWQEFLLANVKLITKPSNAAYYKQLLKKALVPAEEQLELAASEDYDGATKTALAAAINRAKTEHFTSPTEVEALIEELAALSEALAVRIENIDNFLIYVIESQAVYEALDDKYKNSDLCKEAIAVVNAYESVDPKTLSDDELNAAVKAIKGAKDVIASAQQTIDLLTWGASQTAQAANTLGVDGSAAANLCVDDRAVIAKVNGDIKAALYKKIIDGEDLKPLMTKVYDMDPAHQVEEVLPGQEDNYDEEGHPVAFRGINLSGYVWNSHLYIENGKTDPTGWVVTSPVDTLDANIAYNTTPSDETPVVDAQIQIYGDARYDFSQVIENLPAGIYRVSIQTRTPKIAGNGVITTDTIYYNAQDENGVWDKYIYAQGDQNELAEVAPYAGASGLTPTFIDNVKVGADATLKLGAHEHYVSGKAHRWDPAEGAETDVEPFWTGTTYVDYINIYFMEPLPGFDYAGAMTAIEELASIKDATISEIYSISGSRLSSMQKGINIVKYSNGVIRKYIVK